MRIPAYIINLPDAKERRLYMERIISPFDYLDVHFVDAVYGRNLGEDELREQFDVPSSVLLYGRALNRGEIGCTLSHFKCYRRLLESQSDYCLILEDDVTVLSDLVIIKSLVPLLNKKEPLILLLSGDFWYSTKKELNEHYDIANVVDAVGSYAYMVNRAAAKLLLHENVRPFTVADNWSLYKHQGVKIKAIKPYIIDANIENFSSTIDQAYFGENWKGQSFKALFRAKKLAIIKKLYVYMGHFVSKIRK